MSKAESPDFLSRMFVLINRNKRRFVRRTKDGKDYLEQLGDLGLTSIDEAWNCVLMLNDTHYLAGPEADEEEPNGPQVVWTFKMDINGTPAYIKLKDETAARGCVCLSFHEALY